MVFAKHWSGWLIVLFATLNGAAQAASSGAERLLQASAQGDAQKVQVLLAQGVPADVRDEQGNTPLILATDRNHFEVAKILVKAGADVNVQNRMHDSAYLLAGAQGRLDILTLTLRHGADLKSTNRYGGTALIPACERGHVDVVKTLLQAGVDPNHVNNLGWTCLLEAIVLSNGGLPHQKIVALLIVGGADVNLADAQGVSPLRHARERSQTIIADMLMAAKAR